MFWMLVFFMKLDSRRGSTIDFLILQDHNIIRSFIPSSSYMRKAMAKVLISCFVNRPKVKCYTEYAANRLELQKLPMLTMLQLLVGSSFTCSTSMTASSIGEHVAAHATLHSKASHTATLPATAHESPAF